MNIPVNEIALSLLIQMVPIGVNQVEPTESISNDSTRFVAQPPLAEPPMQELAFWWIWSKPEPTPPGPGPEDEGTVDPDPDEDRDTEEDRDTDSPVDTDVGGDKKTGIRSLG